MVATPYAITFRHEPCALAVHAAFVDALRTLRESADTAWAAPPGAAVHGVGHSNGALLHLLIACLAEEPVESRSNVLVSFNNRSGRGQGRGQGRGHTPYNRLSACLPAAQRVLRACCLAAREASWELCDGFSLKPCPRVHVSACVACRQVGEAVPVPLTSLQPAVAGLRGEGPSLAASAADAAAALLRSAAAAGVDIAALGPRLSQFSPALAQVGTGGWAAACRGLRAAASGGGEGGLCLETPHA